METRERADDVETGDYLWMKLQRDESNGQQPISFFYYQMT